MPATERFKVAIVGAGITGLTAAFKLIQGARAAEVPVDVTIFEATERTGGVIKSETAKGFVLELGPDSLFTAKKSAFSLCAELGLEDELIPTNQSNRKSLLALDGKLHALPEGFVMLGPSKIIPFMTSKAFSLPLKFRMALDMVLPPRREQDDETVEQFVTRRFGREALDKIAQPMVGGIYVGDVSQLSAQATLERFVDMERNYGSVIRGLMSTTARQENGSATSGARYSLFVTLRNGLESLVRRLEEKILECSAADDGSIAVARIERKQLVKALIRKNRRQWRLVANENEHDFDAVIMANPAVSACEIVRAADEQIARALQTIDFASSCVAVFRYKEQSLPAPLEGFGFVVPQSQRRSIIAASFASLKYPNRAPDKQVIIRVFLGGVLDAHLLDRNDAELIDLAREDLEYYLGIKNREEESFLVRWPLSMPQYKTGHFQRVRFIEKRAGEHLPGVFFAGNSYWGVGIPDCILSAEKTATMVLKYANTFTQSGIRETVTP